METYKVKHKELGIDDDICISVYKPDYLEYEAQRLQQCRFIVYFNGRSFHYRPNVIDFNWWTECWSWNEYPLRYKKIGPNLWKKMNPLSKIVNLLTHKNK